MRRENRLHQALNGITKAATRASAAISTCRAAAARIMSDGPMALKSSYKESSVPQGAFGSVAAMKSREQHHKTKHWKRIVVLTRGPRGGGGGGGGGEDS